MPYKPGFVRRHARHRARRTAPSVSAIRGTKRRARGGVRLHGPVLPDLGPGRYVLTAVVRDPAQPRGARYPWVLKDDQGLLEDRTPSSSSCRRSRTDDGP